MSQSAQSEHYFEESPTRIMRLFFTLTLTNAGQSPRMGQLELPNSKKLDGLGAVVTYDMNRLQNLDGPHQFFVTLNNTKHIKPESILGRRTTLIHNSDPIAASAEWN